MKLLCDYIAREGRILPGNIVKVDGFVNHQIDTKLLYQMGEELHKNFNNCNVTKVLTVESSGIAIACATAQFFNFVPVVFAKKHQGANTKDEAFLSRVHSFTHNNDYDMTVSKKFLSKDDTVLIVDDFLATGEASYGLIDICKQAGAKIAGIGIIVEKAWQDGGKRLRRDGYHLESLAIINSADPEKGFKFAE